MSGKKEKNDEEERGEERWIESEFLKTGVEEDETDPDVSDLFADPDPHDQFEFSYTTNEGEKIFITLNGYKAELGQTLCSTGLTLWRASEILCEYLVLNSNLVKRKRVLEVRSFTTFSQRGFHCRPAHTCDWMFSHSWEPVLECVVY